MSRRTSLPLLVALLVATAGCGSSRSDGELKTGESRVDPDAESALAAVDASADWPLWRGPLRNGVAADQEVPAEFGPAKNVIWRTKVPGRGHSSPTVVGDRIYVATADEEAEIQSVVAYDRETGDQVWKVDLHQGGFPDDMHDESSHASCTIACDGERLYVAFLNGGAIHATALDLEGEVVWQEEVAAFDSKFGYAPSPTLYKSSVIIASDNQGGGHVTSLDRETGALNWQVQRPAISTYASPVVFEVAGTDQLLIAGTRRVVSYDPLTGEQKWSVEGTADAAVGAVVATEDVVFASGGYPQRDTLAIKADGSGEVLWRTREKSYVPSTIVHDGALYMVEDGSGIAVCFDAGTGEERWRERLGGKFRASPVLAGEKLIFANRRGRFFVVKATPASFELLAENDMGDEAYASPAVCGNRLYLRVAEGSGRSRQEYLYCIGRG